MSAIRNRIQELIDEQENVLKEIRVIQDNCPHETSVYEANGSSGNWDNDSYYWYNFYCYDCRKRWHHEQSQGHGKSLKVGNIDYNKKPEIVELEIKIAHLNKNC